MVAVLVPTCLLTVAGTRFLMNARDGRQLAELRDAAIEAGISAGALCDLRKLGALALHQEEVR